MTINFRGAGGVEKLLKIAKSEADARRVDLDEVEQAKCAAQAALDKIAQSVERERETSSDVTAIAQFEEGMRERRFNLRRTVSSLETASDEMRDKLRVSLAEIAKLEHVLEVNKREIENAGRKREARSSAERTATASVRSDTA